MDSVAFIFSGQGAQKPGMGQSLYNTSSAVKDMFDAAETIRPGTLRQCFEGPAELLRQTDITQPCLYLTDLAAALALRERGILPAAAAGFSLGEIPALAFCGAFSLAEGFRLACERGRLMRESADRYSASMAAVIKLDNETVESLCKAYPHIYPVNYNAPGQLVVSGYADELKAFDADVREAGGRLLPLAVGLGLSIRRSWTAHRMLLRRYWRTVKFVCRIFPYMQTQTLIHMLATPKSSCPAKSIVPFDGRKPFAAWHKTESAFSSKPAWETFCASLSRRFSPMLLPTPSSTAKASIKYAGNLAFELSRLPRLSQRPLSLM